MYLSFALPKIVIYVSQLRLASSCNVQQYFLNSRQGSQQIMCMHFPHWPIAALGDNVQESCLEPKIYELLKLLSVTWIFKDS